MNIYILYMYYILYIYIYIYIEIINKLECLKNINKCNVFKEF